MITLSDVNSHKQNQLWQPNIGFQCFLLGGYCTQSYIRFCLQVEKHDCVHILVSTAVFECTYFTSKLIKMYKLKE